MASEREPGAVRQLEMMNLEIDVREIVPSIWVPTLVMHRSGDPDVPVEGGRWMAEHIPTARFVEFPGSSHGIAYEDSAPIERELHAFLAALSAGTAVETAEPESVLATVLFTDIVGSMRGGRAR